MHGDGMGIESVEVQLLLAKFSGAAMGFAT